MQGLRLGNIFPMGRREEGKNCFPWVERNRDIEVKNM
jgi:hypothetical protein